MSIAMLHVHEQLGNYRIKTVASLTGLSAHVIRKWEERYHLLHPSRSLNSYRMYSEDDIQLLLFVKTLLAQGESIGQLAQAGEQELKQLMQQTPIDLSGIQPAFHNQTTAIIQAARTQDHDRIARIITGWIGQLSLEAFLETVFFPLLRLIGELWHQGGLSISGEHSISQVIRRHLIRALQAGDRPTLNQALIACLPGEHHEIPALSISLLLQNRGWQITYLGPSVSFDVLRPALRRHRPTLMILSCMIEPKRKLAQQWIRTLSKDFQPFCRIMIGGPGLAPYTDLLKNANIRYLPQIREVAKLDPKLWNVN
jgi:MerR family transcriptional regulator, light-induced transcriptional regulator